MLHAIATVSLSGTLPEKLEAAASARFDGVEIFEADLLYFGGSPEDVRQLAADLGLEIMLFQPFRDFEAVPRDRLQRNLDRAEHKFDLMEELGVRTLLLCSNVAPDTIQDDAVAIEDLARLAERAARRGIKIGYEALAWGRHVRTWKHAWRIVDTVAQPNLGLILDSFHTLALGDDTREIATMVPGDRIVFVQIADAPRLEMDVLSWSRHFRCFPGQGEFDVAGFLAPVLAAGYGGPLSLEVFNDDFRAAPARQTAVDAMRSLLYLEERTRERLAPPASDKVAFSTPPVDLFAAPPPSPSMSFGFVEFAVDEAAMARLAAWLERLGFAAAGRHRSKNVTLFRQGGVNLALNAEGESFAQAYFLVHGPSACAVGLEVENASQVLNRARLYRCQPYEGRIGPNEFLIPAVRAPDGSLVYLVDRSQIAPVLYEREFALASGGGANPAGLSRIDHISLAVPDGQFDSWVLFFKAVLGFEAESVFDLPDPYGLVRSRAVRSPDGSVRFPLNISQSRNTATARSVSAYSGAGVQHIALATADIFAAAAELKRRGAAVLRIPANYYDDLAAKFGLEQEFVDRLAAANILYDRDAGGGEFFQLYTEPFEDRFAFELVERRHGYDGFGAANAPVRLAAQAQMQAGSRFRTLAALT
ncbi:bifunctional sugar phosphate isomerase/epimerase/4-hydroxyphenylpyruvate dioxygenase family protein [Benzoatithermus flavus]|uniref:3-dehydroshikimate dehydratase n=1 Tax=Benzoatithermus flavus TaxID=3108223 RepID=A0ABU8XUK8_9PROT